MTFGTLALRTGATCTGPSRCTGPKALQRQPTHDKEEEDEGDNDPWPLAPPSLRGPRLGDEPAFAGPRRGEAARIALAEDLRGRDAFGLCLREIGFQLRRHLLGHRIRHTQPFPFIPALLDERRHHGTSNSIVARTESTPPRTSCHARIPSARARRPVGEAR